jgi:hypothetical protein
MDWPSSTAIELLWLTVRAEILEQRAVRGRQVDRAEIAEARVRARSGSGCIRDRCRARSRGVPASSPAAARPARDIEVRAAMSARLNRVCWHRTPRSTDSPRASDCT